MDCFYRVCMQAEASILDRGGSVGNKVRPFSKKTAPRENYFFISLKDKVNSLPGSACKHEDALP